MEQEQEGGFDGDSEHRRRRFHDEFTGFVVENAPALVAFVARSFPRLEADAQDLAQDAFAIVYARWDQVRSAPSPRGYLFKVARNRAYDVWKPRAVVHLTDDVWILDRAQHSGAIDDVGGTLAMSRFLASMPFTRRKVALLWLYHALAPRDIARRLGMAVGTVKCHQQRIREQARLVYEAEGAASPVRAG
ncbi:RNA polymerase sigma factor [Embleya sp. NPDC127516]|uniref:RNA polymerase sigma factor n=1 Tax=Embleya sp. NPDC127516 TaxID=3363990 RepID=UPI003826AACD